jgi:C-terminal processing protease CtpA/Prc
VAGRKAIWKESNIDDMIDIIVNDENFTRKRIFTNVKKQKNTEVYGKILNRLNERYSQYSPPSSFPLTVEQISSKFKWCVATCKRISLTISLTMSVLPCQSYHDQSYHDAIECRRALVPPRISLFKII